MTKILVTHRGPLTRTSLAVALEMASLASDAIPTHVAVHADAPLQEAVDLLDEIPTGQLGAGLTLLVVASKSVRERQGAAFALLHIPAGTRIYKAHLLAEQALLTVMSA